MKKLLFLVTFVTISFSLNAQDIKIDSLSIDTISIDTIYTMKKNPELSDYKNSWGFVCGDIIEVDIRENNIAFITIDEGKMLTVYDNGIDGFESLKGAENKFALFIIDYRFTILRVDVVDWEE